MSAPRSTGKTGEIVLKYQRPARRLGLSHKDVGLGKDQWASQSYMET
jgi:hypothetical protein